MQVKIRIGEDGTVFVTRINVIGGAVGPSGLTIAIGTGESYHGYKHRRLRKLGNGVHVLKRKLPGSEPEQ
jgi:hypothetical protein